MDDFSRIADQARLLAPQYDKAARERDLQAIIRLRCELAETLHEADGLIQDCLVETLESRVSEDEAEDDPAFLLRVV